MSKQYQVSFLIPTLNAVRVLGKCLESINSQAYPKSKMEIIIADGGSTDATIEVAKKYRAKIFPNKLKTGESGKAVALRQAQGELVILVDSDNVLPTKNWLKKMVAPFTDPEVLGSEPWEFTYRRKDTLVNRYSALIGMGDPAMYFFGNFDKRSVLSEKWTKVKLEQEDKGEYLKVKLGKGILPTIGANGTIWRTKVIKQAVGKSNYLFDTDVPYTLARKKPFWFAKVKVGIIHLFCHQVKDLHRKQRRRAKDFFYLESQQERQSTYQRRLGKQVLFVVATLTVLPLLFQSIKGFLKKPDVAWFFHPVACLMTLWVYSTELIVSWFKKEELDRSDYKQ